jgi:hypothetical protein
LTQTGPKPSRNLEPQGIARGNWIQTDPKKGWFLRLYSPLEPFFTKDWRRKLRR